MRKEREEKMNEKIWRLGILIAVMAAFTALAAYGQEQTGLRLHLGHRAGRNGESDLPELFPRGIGQLRSGRGTRRTGELAGRPTGWDGIPPDPGDDDAGRSVRIPDRRSRSVPTADRSADPRDHPGERTELELRTPVTPRAPSSSSRVSIGSRSARPGINRTTR